MIPGCDSNGPTLCVDIANAVSLGFLRNIASGIIGNPFPSYTAHELETLGILQGNFITESFKFTFVIITVKISRIVIIQSYCHFRF